MAYLGIYTNDLNNFDLSEHLKADTIEELEKKKTSKQYLKIFELNEDILEEAELVCTKVLKWGVKMIYNDLEAFEKELRNQEKEEKTIKQYSGYIKDLIETTQIKNKEDITKEMLIEYKEKLQQRHKDKLNSINIKVLIINKFITFLQLPQELRLKQEKMQKQTTLENVLTFKEFEHLRDYAKNHKKMRLYYLMGVLEGTRHQNRRITIYNIWSSKKARGRHFP